MNKLLRNSIAAVSAATILAACGADISNSVGGGTASSGSADFSTFVAFGDSTTGGYSDAAFFRDGQLNSLGAILAQQFALAGGGAFTQPLMPVGATGSMNFNGTDLGRADRLLLAPTGDPASPVAPSTISPTISTDLLTESMPGLYNNMGVPGAKSFHALFTGFGDPAGFTPTPTANPYFVRMASATNMSMLDDAMAQNPSFFTLWLGANDIFLYAADGGDPTVSGEAAPTPTGTFDGSYAGILAGLNTTTNKGVLVNVPDVSSFPYFTRVPFNAIPLTAAQAAAANGAFAPYNGGVTMAIGFGGMTADEAAARQISFSEGQNAVLILDEGLVDLTGVLGPTGVKMRQATAEDFILLPTATKLGTESVMGVPESIWGVGVPLVDADVLLKAEAAEVEAARVHYNATIKAAADADPDLLLFDVEAKLTELTESGLFYGTGGITAEFVTGGAYSLDGFHPSARGYAVIANLIIDTINTGFGATLPRVDPGEFPTVFYQ